VILWSDEYTGFYGDISARGGVQGGNGGFVETSSKDNLQAFGFVDASAPQGEGGNWLLDPLNITISTAVNRSVTAAPNFAPTATGANVQNTAIDVALGGGTSVTVTTTTAASVTVVEAGTLTVNAPITGPANGGNLTLNADSTLTINAAIDLSANTAADLILTSKGAVIIGGALTVGSAGAGGTITINAGGQTVSQTTALIGDTLTVNAGTIRLADAANQFATVNLNSKSASGDVAVVNTQYRDLDNYTVSISGTAGSGNALLATDTGTVQIGSLNGATGIQGLLLGTSNDTATSTYFSSTPTIRIQTLAAQTSGTIQFIDVGGLEIGTVFGVGGVSASNVRLTTSGSLTQTEPIVVPGVFAASVTGAGNTIELEDSDNNVGSVLLETGDGAISFRDSSGLVVLGITAGGAGSNIGLRVDSGEVTSAPGSFGVLTGTGAINASGDGLALLGGANFRLEILGGGFPLNDVRRVGIDMQGNNAIYLFRNAGELEIASVSANGLSANGILGGERGFVTLTAGGDLTQTATIDMQAPGNLGAPGAGGTLYARTRFDGLLPDRNVTADIILNNSGNQLGNILLETLNFSGDRAAYGLIQYRDQDGFNIMGIRSAWNATLESGISDANGANTQTGPIVLGFKEPGRVPGVGAGGLLLLGERGYDLNDGGVASLGNDIDFLSADIPGFNDGDANRPLTYTDKNTFEIWWVNRDGDNPATLDPDEPIGIVSSGVLTLRARDGNPGLANLNFPTVAGGQQGITLSTYDTVGGTYRPAVVQARGPITITVEDGHSLRPSPVRNTDGVFNMNFGTTLISRDTDDPDVSGITITADNMSLNGSIQALLGAGDVRTQNVILQPFTGSVGDPLVANHNVVIGTKLGRPTTRLELLQNELRTINADTLQIQTASRTLGTGWRISV
jgi:hypothetical protein